MQIIQKRYVPAHTSKSFNKKNYNLFKKLISVLLAIILATGLGTNLSYAAEFIPSALEPLHVTLLQTETKNIDAPQEGSSYVWQIQLVSTGDFVTIPNEEKKSATNKRRFNF